MQESRREVVSALEGMFLSRLKLWEKHNKSLPDNIFIHRDGSLRVNINFCSTRNFP
jgi:eukaryotic translation initiation factor 2C